MVYSKNNSGSSNLLVNVTESQGDDIVDKSFFFEILHKENDERKRKMTVNQPHLLKTSFETEDKLKPCRRLQLAKETNFQTRQMALSYQKTKQPDKDHGLKSSYLKLICDYDTLSKENDKLKNKVHLLTEQLLAAVEGRTKTETSDSEKQIPCIVVGLNESREVVSSTETKVFDSDPSGGNHSSFQEADEDVPAPEILEKKMPTRKRDHEDENNNHNHVKGPSPMVYIKKIMDHSGSSGLVNFTESQGDDIVDKSFFFELLNKADDENDGDSCLQQPINKRQSAANQFHFLETRFEVEDKMESDRKLRLANVTSFQRREVTIWFPKTIQLYKDYGCLKPSYVEIICDNKTLSTENDKVHLLTERLLAAIVVGLNESSEVASSTKAKVCDSDTRGGCHFSFQEPDGNEDEVTIWFPKTRQLYKYYGCLKPSYVEIICDNKTLSKENDKVKINVHVLTERLVAADVGRTKTETFDSEKQIRCIVVGLNESSEVASSTKTKVFDSDTRGGSHFSFQEPDEDVPAPEIIEKKMPTRKRDHEDANNNHVKASRDVPQPNKIPKRPAEILSINQLKEPFDDPIAESLCEQRIVLAKQKTNLSKLTYDLMVEIARRLKKLEHFTCFRSVSKSLHVAVKDEYFEGLRVRQGTPYLMLPVREDGTNDDVRELYSLVEGESTVASLKVPMLKKATMCYESLGWLLAVQVDGSMSLLDPLSNAVIPMPHLHTIPEYEQLYATNKERMVTFIKKMVLSTKPNETSDFIMMVICGDYSSLAFWRSGDEAWNGFGTLMDGFNDVVYDGGEQFYAIHNRGSIWVINLAAGNVERRLIVDSEPDLSIVSDIQNQYILKSIDGSLLCIIRTKDEQYLLTFMFVVYEIDPETRTWKVIDSLGSMAVFLGRNSSIAVDALKYPTERGGVIKANHIYFTDDFWELQNVHFSGKWKVSFKNFEQANGGCLDSGVFNHQTEDIEPIYPVQPLSSHVCPAMFITPNLSF